MAMRTDSALGVNLSWPAGVPKRELELSSNPLEGGVGGGAMLALCGLARVAAELLLRKLLSRPPLILAAKVLISSAVSIFNNAFKHDSALVRFRST
jgi:hypothetical protein